MPCRVSLHIVEHRIEGVQFKKVAVRAHGGRGSVVVAVLPIVGGGRSHIMGDALGQGGHRCGKVVEHPVHPRHLGRRRVGRIGVVHNQGETLRVGGNTVGPFEGRREIVAVFAGVDGGNGATVRKGRRRQFHLVAVVVAVVVAVGTIAVGPADGCCCCCCCFVCGWFGLYNQTVRK